MLATPSWVLGTAWDTYASAGRQHCGVPRRALDRPGRTGYCKTSRGDSGETDVLDLYAVEGDAAYGVQENIMMI